MKRKIIVVTTSLSIGGAEQQVLALAVGLKRRGWEVSVVTCLAPTAHQEDLKAAGIALYSLGMDNPCARLLALPRFIRLLIALRPTVVHSHMFHANVLARLALLTCRSPALVSTVHSIKESSRRSASTHLRDLIYRVTDRLSDRTTFVCQAAAQRHTGARAVSLDRLLVVPNGVNTSVFRPDSQIRARMRLVLSIHEDTFVWLAVGRLMWKKDYATLLQAFARHLQRCQTRVLLLIVGSGPLKGELSAQAESLKISQAVRFLGERKEVSALMNASDALVLSSVVEGLPMVLLEAASVALPTIATRVGGIPDVVLDGSTGFVVPPHDSGALCSAMGTMVSLSPCRRMALGDAARSHAANEYSLEVVLNRWEEVYETCWLLHDRRPLRGSV